MNTYNKSEIMSRAWRMFRNYDNKTFSWCLQRSWSIEKENIQTVSQSVLNKIINNLKPICIKSTKEHFRFLNSKKGRGIMKRSDDDEAKQMVSNGELFFNDILHSRRNDSSKYDFKIKPERKFRNRIVNLENCEQININDYINGND
jgi:hypothetical protein